MARYTRESIDNAIVAGNYWYVREAWCETRYNHVGLFDENSAILAARHGRSAILRIFYDGGLRFTSDVRVLETAAEHGHTDTFAFAFEVLHCSLSLKAAETVVTRGYLDCLKSGILLWLNDADELLREFIDIAVDNGHDACAAYLRQGMRRTRNRTSQR